MLCGASQTTVASQSQCVAAGKQPAEYLLDSVVQLSFGLFTTVGIMSRRVFSQPLN